MKESLLAKLESANTEVHGCFQPTDGQCFYIASTRGLADYGERRVRTFMAHVEQGGELVPFISLKFGVSRTALSSRNLARIGDPDEFLRISGLARLKAILERDAATERDEETILTTHSEDWEFAPPNLAVSIAEYAALKRRILFVLAGLHAQGAKRITRDILLNHLAADVKLIDRAIADLVAFELVGEHDSGAGWRLSAKGREQAESMAVQEVPRHATRAERQFDIFISYASEDRALAETLKAALEGQGQRVWLDKSEITLGDSLIGKLNAGLAVSRYGVVLLSPSYLRKPWPKTEFEALQHKAVSTQRKVILPILHQMTHAELAVAMPLMGPTVTAEFKDNIDDIVQAIRKAIG